MEHISTITCPVCNFKKTEVMFADYSQQFYECSNCKALLKTKTGDCCVFCSYGNIQCSEIEHADYCSY
jgi:hypothetical protein